MTPQNGPVVHSCRYRLVTGCAATYGTQPGRIGHEKSAHADILMQLRDCPVCGDTFKDEAARGMHLSREHGLTPTAERRQELDAEQVQKILAGTDATPVLVPPPVVSPFGPGPVIPPSPNGHSAPPAPPDDATGQIFALIEEVRTLRAENARLKSDAATLAEIRDMLADIS